MRILTALVIAGLVTACSYREPVSVRFFDSRGERLSIYALSKKALPFSVPLNDEGRYRYALERLVTVPPSSSIEISYTLEADGAPLQGGLVIEFEKNVSYTLPLNISFLTGGVQTNTLRYAMPIDSKPFSAFTLKSLGGGKSAVRITALGIVPRRVGFEQSAGEIITSPYINGSTLSDGKPVLVLDPPEEARPAPPYMLRFTGLSRGSAFQTGSRRFEFVAGGAASSELTIQSVLLGEDVFPLILEGTAQSAYISTGFAAALPEPVVTDPAFVLAIPQKNWRDSRYELFSWDIFPSILIFDTESYAVQDRLLKRLSFFAEKKGFRGRVVSDAELEGKHGWNAHDYRAITLAEFFNAAHSANVALNKEERELEAILIANGIILPGEDGGFLPGDGAVISISRESSPHLRARFLVHECYHGIFFIDSDFREFSEARYANFNPKARAFARSYLDYLAYDITDSYLTVNEFMAYIIQQPAGPAGEYFGKYAAGKIEESEWRSAILPKKDEDSGTWPLLTAAFDAEAAAFSDYAFKRWGIAAGRVSRLKIQRVETKT
ncbi:MAG: hypothetical protein LBC77_03455 [Spirochaetaceae bacterium]|jgi:hypothetical protein|nr:hypothetical protein [Spirochaetaceae bacterium]